LKSSAKNIVLKSVDDIFQTEENRADAQRERVQEIPLDQLKPFRNHPFKVRDDQRMLDTVDSIREYGVLVPAIARPLEDGGYEIIAGHRRKRACELAGMDEMPVIVRNLDDDESVIIMVVVLFFRKGIMGDKELPDLLKKRQKKATKEAVQP